MPGVGWKLLVTVVAVALLGAGGAARAADPVLTADVGQGDGFTIGVVDATGSPVKHLDPGTYTLVVHDHSSFHDFHLSGPGVDVTTDIEGIGDRTFTVTLVDGTYFFQCDPHSAQMKGSFTVGTVTAPPPTPAPPPTKLSASLASSATATLNPASGLSAGKYRITVSDRSAKDGFRLTGPGVSKATGLKFRGVVTWSLTLQAGKYSYGSVKRAKLRRVVTVSAG
jgi:hypothetical protein